MSLMQWRPFKDVSLLRQQMDHLFDDLLSLGRDFPQFPRIDDAKWAPAVELRETNSDVVVSAQLPGMAAKDLDVHVTQNAVSIAGEHQEEKQTEEKGFVRSEFQYGRFQRVIPLPAPVKQEEVRSEFKDGVLTLTLPKAQPGSHTAVKVNIATGEVARAAMTAARQQEEHLQDTMRTRAEAELQTSHGGNVYESAREQVTEDRQHEEHLQDSMRARSKTGTA
jgi:HSP20 family protein